MRKVYMGYDPKEAVGYHVCSQSIIKHSTQPVSITPLAIHLLDKYGVRRRPEDSTDFARTRFLVPWLEATGRHPAEWVLFLDGADMLCRGDVAELWKFTHTAFDKAVLVVKHDYRTKTGTKFFGQGNRNYPKKNWSSVMLMNVWRCREYLTPTYISRASGAELHQFKWLPDECLIGDIPVEWNHLVGEYEPNKGAKIVHWTLGSPFLKGYEDAEFADEWQQTLHEMAPTEITQEVA